MPLRFWILPTLIAALLAVSAGAQETGSVYWYIAKAYNSGDAPEVLSSIGTLKKQEPQIFNANGFAYLAGRTSENSGDPALAARWFVEASVANSLLRPYALWRLSRIMRRTGNLPAERLFLLEAETLESDSAASAPVSERLFRSYFESGDNKEVARLARSGPFLEIGSKMLPADSDGPESTGNGLDRELLPTAGRSLFVVGDLEAARALFDKAIMTDPDPEMPDDIALQAVEGLDRMDAAGVPGRNDSLDAETHFQRAQIYQFNRRFRAARVHYRAIFEKHRESERAAPALFEIGTGYARDRDYHNAIEWFERLQGEFPEARIADDALYQTASAYANVGKAKESSSRFERFIDEHSDSERAVDAYLNLIDLYRDEGEPGEALKWTERLRIAYPEGKAAAEAFFARAKIHISQNDWEDALAEIESALEEGPRDRDFEIEAGFLRGYVLEKLGKPYAAADAYAQLPDGLGSYYGWRATERFRELRQAGPAGNLIPGQYESYLALARAKLSDSNAREVRFAATAALRLSDSEADITELSRLLRRAYAKLPEYSLSKPPDQSEILDHKPMKTAIPEPRADHRSFADALLLLGIYDEGASELEIVTRTNARIAGQSVSSKDSRLLADLYRRGGLYKRSVKEAEARWRLMPEDHPIQLIPDAELENLYPVPFRAQVLRYSAREGIDPRFLLSIMRQESRFDPAVKSFAAARGLMQFINSTATETAAEVELSGFVREDLYDPATSILLGSHYLAKLLSEFPEEQAAVAASYNAGEDRMRRWYRRSNSSDPDRYVPEIRFTQTKDYVRKVMANYRAYKYLYDARLERQRPASANRRGW